MAKYVDGFVLSVPKKKLAAYKKMASQGAKTWMKHGALDYRECVIQDGKPQHVKFTFAKMAKAKPSEVVIFSYIVFKSRKHRDEVNAKVMSDPSMQPADADPKKMMAEMPFDMDRMAYAGFETLVER